MGFECLSYWDPQQTLAPVHYIWCSWQDPGEKPVTGISIVRKGWVPGPIHWRGEQLDAVLHYNADNRYALGQQITWLPGDKLNPYSFRQQAPSSPGSCSAAPESSGTGESLCEGMGIHPL